MNGSCKTCRYYGFYKMITGGPYGYAGPIPCVNCSRFSSTEDNYEQAAIAPFPSGSEMRQFTCPAWWYQAADYEKKPQWDCCGIGGGLFWDCEHFAAKRECWERWDKEQEEAPK